MSPRQLVLVVLCIAAIVATNTQLVAAWDQQPDGYEVLDGPSEHESFETWRNAWESWRRMELLANRYNSTDTCNVYNAPHTQWTQRNFVQALVMLNDRALYDRTHDNYTVDAYVDALEARVGKLDSVLLWSSYPNIGIDNRNQWDLLRTLPGGLARVRTVVQQFHARNVRVFITYNPWDTATRDEPGLESTVRTYSADITTLNNIVAAINADGVNGDTMYGVPRSFYNCSAPLVAAPEGGVPSAFLSHNAMSWGYLNGYTNFPPVARAKFLEPRHMVQVCARWSLNRMVELQTALFNGVGYVVWENVWGIWNGMTEREDAAAKRVFTILRQFAFATTSAAWTPYAIGSRSQQVVASAFPAPERGGWLYTIVSSADHDTVFQLPLSPAQTAHDVKVYDAYHGRELSSRNANSSSDSYVEVPLEPFGLGAIFVAASGAIVDGLDAFLATMRALTATRLDALSTTRPLLKQTLVRADRALPDDALAADATDSVQASAKAAEDDWSDMVHVRGAGAWWFNVSGVQIEPVAAWTPNGRDFGTGVQFPWEQRPTNSHATRLAIQDFWIDRHPVTNAAFARFLVESQYKPATLERFLAHWDNRVDGVTDELQPLDHWRVPSALANSPVVYVAREDAVAYARFYRKRLPHDWEWQYVASNGERYDQYPWGDRRAPTDMDANDLPRVSRAKDPPPLEPVGTYPHARSTAFDVHDLVGYVWQMTDAFCDAHTCGQLLRGGSFYQPVAATGSDPNWYFPQALAAHEHNRLLMTSASYDRSPLIGFRCATSAWY